MQNNEKPLVSVVIPCYNHEKFVQDCIQSVIDQTYENIELIIIDDGSKDSSVDKIKEMIPLCEERFSRFEFRYRPNKGLSSTLNEGLEWCNGKYFSAIASDDQMLEYKIKIQVEYLESSGKCVGVFGGVISIDTNGNYRKKFKVKSQLFSFDEILLGNYTIYAPTQMYILNSLKKVGGFSEDTILEDLDILLKITSSGGRIHNIDKILSKYREHENNITKKTITILDEENKVISKYKKFPQYKQAKRNLLKRKIMKISFLNRSDSRKIALSSFKSKDINLFMFIILYVYTFIPFLIIYAFKKVF